MRPTYLAKGEKTLVTKDVDVIRAVREYYGTWNGESALKSDSMSKPSGYLPRRNLPRSI